MWISISGGMHAAGTLFAFLVNWLGLVAAYNCIQRCTFESDGTLVTPRHGDDNCLISIPDNPQQYDATTLPCQILIEPNCTSFCQVRLNFAKFDLPECNYNLTWQGGLCDQINSCEYVVLQEQGKDINGFEISGRTRFHGQLTTETFDSRTDKVLLQFCYRSETFTARNILLEYVAIDPKATKDVFYGPWSVYVLGSLVVAMLIAIFVIRFCPWLKPCLDPQSPKRSSFDV